MLSDRFGRAIDYLRLSVTDRCDLRCSYCLPKGFKGFEEPAHWLTFDEIERVAAAFVRLGARRIRLTGGEPLLRRELPLLAGRLSALPGLADLSLSTNATQLERHAKALRQAGVKRLNVSLDSLRRDCVAELTGSDSLPKALAGLSAAKAAGFERIKINMVPIAGVNDGDIEAMAEFCIEHGFILRLIEAMPMGDSGRGARGSELAPILERLGPRFGLSELSVSLGGGPARYWGSSDGRFTLGLITPISQHFCASCNRLRMSVDGTLYLCLGQEQRFELRPLLRAGCSDAELEAAIRAAIELKPEKHDFLEAPAKVMRFMSQTGG
ncbi:GTP 3',8-cyclase MoaA [Chromobacterium violaceum]|uniref:GTP 3',8-cyclase n=1 Tax=Chromobacterium violaceum (strain ATCC 12472 / DSM 30191 / JCM 1249 / CCUG 213 / NBRC 12614 / NCIMB 9131 / NCTC 9757 / MK) TaxID=243365 RepID=Q7NV14_CHRVO|nr:GTP 3',8-cyclase MoaA [Chromobacterium violaceum]AAQ60203.1 molybdenum cofactor biosynthesis protein A [Chromobacterium violaceum ATCC 12472]SUX35735.1 Molybdenum cofactor biosynthesis protein A [Chromobacterium violaceum]